MSLPGQKHPLRSTRSYCKQLVLFIYNFFSLWLGSIISVRGRCMSKRRVQGFSIIEAVIALGLISIGAYFVASMIRTNSLGQKTLLAQNDATALTETVANLLKNSTACQQTLNGKNPATGAAINSFKDATGSTQFEVGKIYGNRGVRLLDAAIGGTGVDAKTNIQKWTPNPPPPASATTGTAFVKLNWEQTGEDHSRTGPRILSRYFMVFVINLTGDLISDCVATTGGVVGGGPGTGTVGYLPFWQTITQLGDSSIFQGSTGNIGIGTETPSAKLEVAGSLRISGDPTAPCNAAAAGTIRYIPAGTGAAPGCTSTSPATVHVLSATFTDNCNNKYALQPGCFVANGNPVDTSCIYNTAQFRDQASGHGCGSGNVCSKTTGVRYSSASDGNCAPCYQRFVRQSFSGFQFCDGTNWLGL